MREATEILPSRGKLGVLRSGLDLAQRAGMDGIQEWLSFYFKSPMTIPRLYPEYGLFIQHMKLKNTLRAIVGENLITYLGLNYYE
jgi:myo-inositol-1-phosphate synthase